jgi:A/G-specific adenine glycosylase
MARFPTAAALAEAPLSDVLKAWEGLGYYRRARRLHEGAKEVVARCGGRLPETAAALRALPGIGPYTAGAIASIAFGADEPALDGNAIRVLCRLRRIRAQPRETKTRKRVRRLARKLLPPGRAGEVNQALMALGATLCTPRGPACGRCPVRKACKARAAGRPERLPVRRKRKPVPHYDVGVAVILRGRRILIDQRLHTDTLGGGLWEFPGGKCADGEGIEACVLREVREELGITVRLLRPLCTVRHAYSHFRVTLHAYLCRHSRGRPATHASEAVCWVRLDELEDYAFPAGSHKIIRALRHADELA